MPVTASAMTGEVHWVKTKVMDVSAAGRVTQGGHIIQAEAEKPARSRITDGRRGLHPGWLEVPLKVGLGTPWSWRSREPLHFSSGRWPGRA